MLKDALADTGREETMKVRDLSQLVAEAMETKAPAVVEEKVAEAAPSAS